MWKEYYNSGDMKETRRKLRNNATKHEKIMWEKLRGSKFMWLKFRRQHSVWRYILDFYCSKIKIWIELDWNQHLEEKAIEYDNIRTEYLESDWINIYRFSNFDIENNLEKVLEKLKKEITNNIL
jgi:very-short-patch-repair endonuclease